MCVSPKGILEPQVKNHCSRGTKL